jgi:hypothetical protein
MVIEGGFYCNHCRCIQDVVKKAHLCARIVNGDGEYSITIEGQWLVALVRMSEEQFLALSRGNQIKLLSTLKVKGIYSLTPMAVLCGYEEHMEVSIIETNSTQGSEGTFRTPPKRKLDDMGVSTGSASTTKTK